ADDTRLIELVFLETVSVTVVEVLVAKLPVPAALNTAVKECVPTLKLLLTKVASPEPFTATVANVVAPSLKVTLPTGVPAPELVVETWALKVTDCPKRVVGGVTASVVLELALLTVWVKLFVLAP